MTFETTTSTSEHVAAAIERLHNRLADTGDDIWIAPVDIDGDTKLAVVRGAGIGRHVFEYDAGIELRPVNKTDKPTDA
jgi:hypothetical protein